jgi:lactobin A/cerein 7B family class IIb bacteriocin
MKNLELENFGVVELTDSEMQNVHGGDLPWWAWALWAVAVVVALVTELP